MKLFNHMRLAVFSFVFVFSIAVFADLKTDLNANQFHYVLVTGFLNEAAPVVYFLDNIKALNELGVSNSSIEVVNLSSGISAEVNSEILYGRLKKIASVTSKPIIVIAHSKGGLEVLGMSIRHSEFVEQKIEKIYIVQGLLGGSHVADYSYGMAHRVDLRMPINMAVRFLAVEFLENFVHWYIAGGLYSATTFGAKKYLDSIRVAYTSLARKFGDKVFYITSSETKGRFSYIMQPTGSYLSTYYGKNDGLILVKDQIVKDIGTVVAQYDCDHLDLVTHTLISNKPYLFRRNFTVNLVTHAVTTP